MDLKEQVRKIFSSFDGGNSLVINSMHYYLNDKKFLKAKKVMVKELGFSSTDADILISYYEKKLQSKATIVEITAQEVVATDLNNPVDSLSYLFVYGQGIYQSDVYESYRSKELEFYANNVSVNINKARQVFRIDWDF